MFIEFSRLKMRFPDSWIFLKQAEERFEKQETRPLDQLKKPKHKLFKVDFIIQVVQNNDSINYVSLFLVVCDVKGVDAVAALCNARS
jgi:hypothetical protein